jgi:hypothetical protein
MMKTFWRVIIGAALLCASGVLAASAWALPSSHDRCTATGNEGSYTLEITIPAGAPAQRGFAVGAPGTSISNIDIAGTDGTPSTSGLPRNTSGQWLFASAAPRGVFSVEISTTAPVAGSFVVSAATTTPRKYFAPFRCALRRSGGPSSAFTASGGTSYDAATHAWKEPIPVAGAGSVSVTEVFSSTGKAVITRSGGLPPILVEPASVTATKAGTVTITLTPTAAGTAALQKTGSISLYLSVMFHPADGLPNTKVIRLVLRASGG